MVMNSGDDGNPVFDTSTPGKSISLGDIVAALVFPQELTKITTNVADKEQLKKLQDSAARRSYELARMFLEARKNA